MKPIIFSTEMVKAILDGRKTQTRRVIKLQPIVFTGRKYVVPNDSPKKWLDADDILEFCPYRQVGDKLWIRETWGTNDGTPKRIFYKADNNIGNQCRWKSSIHMWHWASRITLEVTDVRIEKVQEISEKDAIKEGVARLIAHSEDLGSYVNYLAW